MNELSKRVFLIKISSEVYSIDMVKLTLKQRLDEREISRYELAKRTGIQYQIIDKYYKNKVKRYDSFVLDRICAALDCGVGDILEYRKDE